MGWYGVLPKTMAYPRHPWFTKQRLDVARLPTARAEHIAAERTARELFSL